MDLSLPRYALKARYLFPVDRPPLADGLLLVDRGRIAAVQTAPADCETVELGNVAIIPGLVNAHVHLEFSDLVQPLGRPGIRLPAWIRQVLQYRQRRSAQQGPHGPVAKNIRDGLTESLRCGTTLLGEIASSDWPPAPADLPAIDMVVFRELICLRPSQLAQIEEDVQRHLQTAGTCSWQAGLSPHAPFTCHGKAVQLAVETSRRYRLPLAMHLAESPEEREWLQTGQGPLADLLADRQADTYPGPLSVDEIVRQLAGAHRALIVHGNYLSDAEIKSVAAARDRLSVVYCPRTHAYFQHAPYPLQKYLAAGVTVALGTDGRGSNPDLSLLAELRHVAAGYPHLPRDQILNMGTLAGATALGQADRCGSLTPGKEANFAVVPLPDADPADPHELLLHSQHEVQATIFRGAEWSR